MTRGPIAWVVAALGVALMSCAADVVLGINHDAGALSSDGGDDGGASDGGADAGATDAGSLDAGTPDAGGADAGSLDAGTLDAGAADAGLLDAGTPDAGDDGGVPDVTPFFDGALAVERGDLTVLSVGVRNLGTRTALDAGLLLTLPLGLSYRASATCASTTPQDVACPLGDVLPGGVVSTTVTLAADAGLGWRRVHAQALSELDAADANDTSDFPMVVTGVGTQVVPVTAPRVAALDACFGTGLMSYSQCTPGSLLSSFIVFFPDGGVEPLDGGFNGSWGQAPHQRNLGFRFYFGPLSGRQYAGASTTATCFEGVSDIGSAFYVGAFRVCLQ